MTDQHPIAPPQELIDQWLADAPNPLDRLGHVATQAARWGADQELEACCGWIESSCGLGGLMISVKFRCEVSDLLRAARRLKPPSLKQQALEALDSASYQPGSDFKQIDSARSAAIRRALEALPDD